MSFEKEQNLSLEFNITHHETHNTYEFPIAVPAAPPVSQIKESEALAAFDAEFDEAQSLPLTPDAPVYIDSLLKNALLLVDNGDYKLASNLLRNILLRESHNVEAIEWLGYCFTHMNDLENALKCYRELVKHQPDEYSYSTLAETLYNIGQVEEAEHFYKLALDAIEYESPLLFNIHKNLGNICIKAGDYEAAEENFNKAYIVNPHSDVLYVNYGTLELQKGQVETALERYRKAIELNAQNDMAWVGIALIHRDRGDFDLAYANIEKALDINRMNKVALKVLTEWSFSDNKIERAISRLQDYLEINDSDLDISLWLTEAFYRRGDLQGSDVELQRAVALNPNRAEVLAFQKIIGQR